MTNEEIETAEADCAECWLNSDEYRELTDYGDVFQFCQDWLRRREMGLEIPRESLTWKEEESIVIVKSQMEWGRARRMKQERKSGQDGSRDRGKDDGEYDQS